MKIGQNTPIQKSYLKMFSKMKNIPQQDLLINILSEKIRIQELRKFKKNLDKFKNI